MIGIIFNPTARGNKALHFREQLGSLGDAVQLVPTQGPGDATRLARELAARGIETVVAAGGDGTINEVLNGLSQVSDALERVRLGVIPLGTVNVVAKELGIPVSFQGAWRIIQAGRERQIDLPTARFRDPAGNEVERQFFLMAGAGLSSRAVERVDWSLKVRFGPLAYVWAGVQAMRPPHPAVQVRSGNMHHQAEWVEIGSGTFFGGRYELFPGAELDDGVLDLTLAPRVSWPVLVRVYLRLLTRTIRGSSDVLRFRSREVTLSADTPVPLHLDGDVVGFLPATIRVRPRALRVIIP